MSTATTVTPNLPNLQELEAQLRGLEVKRGKFEAEHGRLSDRMLRIDEQARSLKVKLSDGDPKAGANLDLLDSEKKDILRRQEGLAVSLAEIEAQKPPLIRDAQALRIAAAEEQRRLEFEAARDNIAALVRHFLLQYADTSRAPGEIRVA